MFTGIIQALGKVQKKQAVQGDMRFTIDTGKLDLADVALGDSIATNGTCLTVVEILKQGFVADVSSETLDLTTLGHIKEGSAVNLEKALRVEDRLGGHIVSGHVDGLGEIVAIKPDARSQRYHIKAADECAKYIAHKGSITVDGVSLTVNAVNENVFELCIVPHTLQETIFPSYKVGSIVNLEVDVIARYVERLLQYQGDETPQSGLSEALLAEHGFMKN